MKLPKIHSLDPSGGCWKCQTLHVPVFMTYKIVKPAKSGLSSSFPDDVTERTSVVYPAYQRPVNKFYPVCVQCFTSALIKHRISVKALRSPYAEVVQEEINRRQAQEAQAQSQEVDDAEENQER